MGDCKSYIAAFWNKEEEEEEIGVFCTVMDARNVVHTTKSEIDHVSMYPQSGGVSKGGSCHEWDYPIQVIAYLQIPFPGNLICLSSSTFRNLTKYCPVTHLEKKIFQCK